MPLVKYSYATTMVRQSRPTWTHLPDRDNMFAVFDLVSNKGLGDGVYQQNVLKVIRGGDLMESINLDDMQEQARRDEECAVSTQIQDADRLVSILVKSPLVAIRYQLPNGKIRRMQMKFVRESDYTMTVGLLQRLELPIRDPKPSSRPQTALSISSSTTQQRLASAVPPPCESPSDSQRCSLFAPSNHNITARSSNVMLGSSPYLPSSQIPGLAKRSITLNRSTSTFEHGSHCDLPAPVRPFSSSSSFDNNSHVQHAPHILADLYSGTYLIPSRTIPETPWKMSSAAKSSPAVGGGFRCSASQFETSAMPRRALFCEDLTGKQRFLNAGHDNDNNLDQFLPPRRELPFAKLELKQPSTDVLPKIQSSSSLDVIPGPGGRGTTQPVKAQTCTLKAKAKQPTSAAFEPTYSSTDPPDNPVSSYKPSTAPTSSKYNTPNFPRSSPPPVYAMGTRTATSRVPTVDNQAKPGQPQAPTAPTTYLVDNEVSDEYFAGIDAFVQKYHDRPIAETYFKDAAADEAAFAALPEAERLAAINAEIGELIGDENFAQLCEDVGKSWKRITLGF